MKKIAGLLMVFTLASCASVKINTETQIEARMIDYTLFMDQGVFVSPYSCENRKYSPIGEVMVEYTPAIKTVQNQKNKYKVSYPGMWRHEVDRIDIEAAVQKLVDVVKAKGGNAVFDIKYSVEQANIATVTYDQLIVTGFAVKLDD